MSIPHGRVRLVPQLLAVAVACCMAAAPSSAADASDAAVPSCVSKLEPCKAYLNATDTTPVPDSCCDPLKETATMEAVCVCATLMNKAALQVVGVAPEQGVLLAKLCGVTTDASTCAKYAAAGADAAASSVSTGTAASTVAKPTESGGTAHHLSLMAATSLVVGFSFIWWSIVA